MGLVPAEGKGGKVGVALPEWEELPEARLGRAHQHLTRFLLSDVMRCLQGDLMDIQQCCRRDRGWNGSTHKGNGWHTVHGQCCR